MTVGKLRYPFMMPSLPAPQRTSRKSPVPAPRLYVITATKADVAVVFARTAGWFHIARWDLLSGSVSPGAWLHGGLYPRRCDISPDGEFLYYFGIKGGRAYHAISRMPWLTALALWRASGTYSNGGHFVHVPRRGIKPTDEFLQRPPTIGDSAPLLEQHRLRMVGNATTAYKAERRRGWLEHEACPPHEAKDVWDERRAQILFHKHPTRKLRLILTCAGITHALGNVEGRKPSYSIEHGTTTTPLPDVVWADWDRQGRLLVATAAGALEIRDVAPGASAASQAVADAGLSYVTSVSLAGIRPAPTPSPLSAQRW